MLSANLAVAALAADNTKKTFDVPAGSAAETLKRAAQQAGLEIMFPVETVQGVRTGAVKGDYAPLDAINQMLAGTDLVATKDEASGALTVKRNPPAPAATPSPLAPKPPASTASTNNDDMIVLNPFEVKTDKDTSYGALNSNSITRFNTELDKIPVVADIMTEQFMQDTAVTSLEDLFSGYGSGAGQVLATPESDSTANAALGDRFSVSQLGQRGLSAGNARRDGFQFASTQTNATSLFDTERVEVIKGSQGLLYGASGAGGIINLGGKQAKFNNNNRRLSFRVDQYGSKRAELDVNAGTRKMAARFDVLQQNTNTRSLYVGDNTEGYYGALAFRLPFNTTLRFSAEGTHNDRFFTNNTSVSFGSTGNDPRNGTSLMNLLKTNQLGTINPATGLPYPSGLAIDNGHVTDRNAKSWGGWQSEETQDNTMQQLTIDTVWTKWLSTSFGGMYNKTQEMRNTNLGSLTPPSSFKYTTGTNPNPFDDWAVSTNFSNSENPGRNKQYRAAILLTNDIGSFAHSQTSIGFDRQYSDSSGGIAYQYYLANSDGSVTIDPTKSNLGRTQIPTAYWTVGNGPVQYPYWKMGAKQVMYQGQLYTRMPTNPRDPSWISATNPLGLASIYQAKNYPTVSPASGGNSGGFANETRNQGYYFANYTSWFNDRFTTLVGARSSDSFNRSPNTSNTGTVTYNEKRSSKYPSYNVGVDFRVPRVDWLRAYAAYSRTFNTTVGSLDPYGNNPLNPTGYTYEAGLKFTSTDSRYSGYVAGYQAYSEHDNYNAGTTFRDSVNPNGLNGRMPGMNGDANQWAQFDKISHGVELILTAEPVRGWRARLFVTAQEGTVQTDSSYKMLYNDQFYTDGKGNVTYANGQPFLVPTDTAGLTALGKQTTRVDPSSAAAYKASTFVPLTLQMINNSDPTNPYYAFGQGTLPQNAPINGSIGNPVGATSQGTQYLKNALANFQNSIGQTALTGVTGLPFSAMQYAFADPAGLQGIYTVQKKGNYAVGAPAIRVNFTNSYAFQGGWLKGFEAGGTLALAYYNRSFYYATPDRARHLFGAPINNPQVNAMFAYTRKFRHVTWRTQVNINNVFNRYVLVLNPNNGTGFNNPGSLNATYYGVPRSYVWTNSFSF
jgi:outer membrane receptor for ferric coprogen and ferric-rhodotorulic acid